eukprot:m.19682 g.19682  ORF g.19682 m.19682 type:complete len:1323 (-) comp5474_c0_seq1:216-4184(-)
MSVWEGRRSAARTPRLGSAVTPTANSLHAPPIQLTFPRLLKRMRDAIDRQALRKGARADDLSDEVKCEIISRLAADRDAHGLPSHVLSTLRQLSLEFVESADDAATPEGTTRAVRSVLTSEKYHEYKAVLLRDLEEAVEQTLTDEDGLDPHLYSVSPDVSLWRRGSRTGATGTSSNSYSVSGVQSVDLGEDFGFASFSGVLPLGTDLGHVCQEMASTMPAESRLHALQDLAKYEPSDLLHSPSWDELSSLFCEMLASPEPEVASAALDYFYRVFYSRSEAARDMFTLLADHLCGGAARLNLPVDSTLDPDASPSVQAFLHQAQALQDFQHEMPKYWIRFGERNMEPLAKGTAALLLQPLTDDWITTANILALSEPRAQWLHQWMRGQYSRRQLLASLAASPIIFRNVALLALRDIAWRTATAAKQSGSSQRGRGVYLPVHLRYLNMLHNVSIVAAIIRYKESTQLFPIQVDSRDGSAMACVADLNLEDNPGITSGSPILISLQGLLVEFIRAFGELCGVGTARTSRAGSRSPWESEQPTDEPSHRSPLDIAAALREAVLGLPELILLDVLLLPGTIGHLLRPIQECLDRLQSERPGTGQILATEYVAFVVDLCARVSRYTEGRKFLTTTQADKSESPAGLLTRFMMVTFREVKVQPDADRVERATSLLSVVRLLYSSHEGFWLLDRYHIDKALVESAQTTPSTPSLASQRWSRNLIDGLLHLTATPGGLYVMQQAGVTHLISAAYFMFQRFRKKLQVGKYEKFGYGVFVSQLSATSLGMRALYESGFVDTFVSGLFAALERDNELRPREELRVVGPSVTKAATYCLKALSTYEGLGYLLHVGGAEGTDDPPHPTDVHSLIRQLALLESPHIVAQRNAETFHMTGLRILLPLLTCLDSLLTLESLFGLTRRLLSLQESNRHPENNDFIIDEATMMRNRVLVAAHLVGGAQERRLPPLDLDACGLPLPLPLFSSLPVPEAYWIGSTSKVPATEDALAKELTKHTAAVDECEGAVALQELLREALAAVALNNDDARAGARLELTALVAALCQKHAKVSATGARSLPPIKIDAGGPAIDQRDEIGVETTVAYGVRLGILSNSNCRSNFEGLIRALRSALATQQHQPEEGCKVVWDGFDWFAATIYLMCNGDVSDSIQLLEGAFNAARTASGFIADYVWYASVSGTTRLSPGSIHPVYFKMTHFIEQLVASRLPAVRNAFRLSGLTVAQVCTTWIRQCFWNVLDWVDIVQYFAVSLLYGPRMQAFFCVALFRHLEPAIVEQTQTERLTEYLLTSPIEGFSTAESMSYMLELDAEYHDNVEAFVFDAT